MNASFGFPLPALHALALSALALQAATPPVVFRTQPAFPVGDGPVHLVVGDFNGDARPDLATANFHQSTVSILSNAGGGTFGSAVHCQVGTQPDALATGDLNGDGKLDLITADARGWNQPGSLTALMGRGDGTFEPGNAVTVGRGPRGVALADFDGDGNLDVATAISGGWTDTNQVNVLRGRGDGTFESPAWYAVGMAPAWIAAGDINADGKPDLVTANAGPGANGTTCSVLTNLGDGTFAAAAPCAVGSYPGFVLLADLNADGKLDLAAANRGSLSISLAIGRGDGAFEPATSLPVPMGATQIAAGDFNGDGFADLAVLGGNYGSGAVSLFLGSEAGLFTDKGVCSVGTALQAIALSDLDGDSKPDLAVSGDYDDAVLFMAGRGDGTFNSLTDVYPVAGEIRQVVSADLNQDGKPDLATANPGSQVVSVLLQGDAGSFLPAVIYPAGEQPMAIKAADLNNDGRLDLITAGWDGTLNFLRGRESAPGAFTNDWGIAGYQGTLRLGSNHQDVAVADLNHDGWQDLVTANYYGASLNVALGRGDGTFVPGASLAVGSGPVCLRTDDFDADGEVDLAVGYDSGTLISLCPGLGTGAFAPRQEVETWEIPWFITSGDIDFDGKPDLVAAHYDWRRISVMLNRTTNGSPLAFGPARTHDVANDPVCVALGDFNGDNRPDIISANYASVSLLLGLGDGTFLTATNYFAGGSWAAVGDFNVDSMPDIALDLGGRVGVFWNDTLPQLQIGRVPEGVRIAYPAWDSFKLESQDLNRPGAWSALSITPALHGSQFVVTNGVSGAGQAYRLSRPRQD